MMAKTQQFKNVCIFCSEDKNLADEHFVPQWLSKAFPMENSKATLSNKTATLIDGSWETIDRTRTTNPMQTLTIRCVCAACNNGWMSTIEANAKSIIQKIRRALLFINLSPDEVSQLASWIALLSIKLELLDKDNRATPDSDINHLYENKRPADNLHIWIAPTDADNFNYSNTPVSIQEHENFDGLEFNCRVVSFVAGGVMFVALTAVPTLESTILPYANKEMHGLFVKLWPREEKLFCNFKSMKTLPNDLAFYYSKSICGVLPDHALRMLEKIYV